jgi:hypothetical protein
VNRESLGALLIAVSAAAQIAGLVSSVAPSTVTGPGAGLCLLAFGLATYLARRDDGIGRPAGHDGIGKPAGTTALGGSCLIKAPGAAADRASR